MASTTKQNLDTQVALAVGTRNGDSVTIQGRAKKVIAHLTVAAPQAGATSTVKIQHSPDKVSWFDYISFAASGAGAVSDQLGRPASDDLAIFQHVRSQIVQAVGTATVTVNLWFEG